MAEVSFKFFSFLSFVLFLQIETYYFFCYNNVIFLVKFLKLRASSHNQQLLTSNITNTYYFLVFVYFFLTAKGYAFSMFGLLTITAIYFLYLNSVLERCSVHKLTENSLYLVLTTFFIFLVLLSVISSFLTFFFYIELYSVLYYFCFLSSYNFSNQTILKYKNGLLFLLWNNFLTSFFLALGCFLLLKVAGTTDFAELVVLGSDFKVIYVFLIGLFWKLGLPLFHFFKLEVYKYLLKENVFMFSILTTTINIIILLFCLSQDVVLTTIICHNYLVLPVMFSVLLTLINLNINNILNFLALSSVFTMSTVITLFLI